jgi:cytochrome P450
MTIDKLPFTDTGAQEPEALSDFYQELHGSSQSTFYDEETDAFVAWRHVDVSHILSGIDQGVSNKNTLDPLDTKLALATNPRTFSGLGHLLLSTTPATANAPTDAHTKVTAVVYDRDSPLSLNRRHFVDNYGELVIEQVTAATEELADTLHRRGVADFSHDYVRPLASRIIGEILGFSRTEQELIQQWSDAQTSLLGRRLGRAEQGSSIKGLASLAMACRGLVKARRTHPQDDLASLLASEEHGLSIKLATSTSMNLIAAGYATTYGTMQNSLRYLSTPGGRTHWERLESPEYAQKIAPELIRLETGLIGWKRFAEKSVKLADGSIIPAGHQIVTLLGAANRDPIFADPDVVKLGRPKLPKSLSFGIGRHLCMGQELAMMEITSALVALRTSLPTLTVEEAPDLPITYEPDTLFRTIRSLPVSCVPPQ